MKKVKVVQKPDEKEVPAEIIAQEILKIAQGMRVLESTRLTRKAIVTLIHEHSKVARGTIEVVLNNLSSLEETWLKKR